MVQFFSSLRFRLIGFVLLAVIPAFGVILYGTARHRGLTAAQIQRNALGTARLIAAEQERYIQNAHQFLVTLARLPQIRENAGTDCHKILAGLIEPLYGDLNVYDAKGNPVCGAFPRIRRAGNPASVRGAARSHDFFVGEFRTMPDSRRAVVDLACPVLGSPGVLKAVVHAALDLGWIARVTAETHLNAGASFTLVDGEGTVLLRYPDEAGWTGKRVFLDVRPVAGSFEEIESTIETRGADGLMRLFAFSQLKSKFGGRAVYVGVDVPAAAAFAEADRIARYSLIVLGFLTALTLAGAWFGADVTVLRRVRDLVAAMRRVANGELSTRTSLAYGAGELGEMARTFDELAETLERRDAEARRAAEQIQRQRQRQQVLHDLDLAIMSTLDPAAVLRTLLENISALFPSSLAAVSWINKETGELEDLAQTSAADEGAPGAETERGLAELVLKQARPLAIANAQLDPRTTHPEFFRRRRLVSYLGLPMISKGELLGVLSLYGPEARVFDQEEIDFLMDLATQAAIAIHNSRLYEEIRNQANELHKSNKIKDEFLGVMSHELRTPLNIIMNYSEALRMEMFGALGGDQVKATEKIRSQASQLLCLINGILEITKIETGTVTVQAETIDLNAFLAELRSDYMLPNEKRLALEWCHPDDLPTVVSDRTKLKHILTNLINNAIKFTDHGWVAVTVEMADADRELVVQVSDTGPGIPEELIPVVFDKFRQIDSTTTRSHSGAGLGLYIVKTFVELLGGSIGVRSRIGEGSTFTVRLPVAAAGQRALPAGQQQAVEAARGG